MDNTFFSYLEKNQLGSVPIKFQNKINILKLCPQTIY